METSIIVTGLFLTNITWTNDWCNIDNFNITTNWLTKRHTTSGSTGLLCRQRNMYPSKNLFWNYYSIFPAPWPMTHHASLKLTKIVYATSILMCSKWQVYEVEPIGGEHESVCQNVSANKREAMIVTTNENHP